MSSINSRPHSEEVARIMQLAESLTVKEILNQAGHGVFSTTQQRKRADLLHAIEASPTLQKVVEDAFQRKQEARAEQQDNHIKRARICASTPSLDLPPNSPYDSFLVDPDEAVKVKCLANFIDRTSNTEMHKVVCFVCAGEFFMSETSLVDLRYLPNRHLLVPQCYHPAHETIHSMLLYSPSVTHHSDFSDGYICSLCMHDLRHNQIPSHALANGLWIGEVPPELSILSLAERILIGLYYPSAFVIKLYPQKKGARHWDTSALNSGIRGNVSTYRLNTQDISAMIEGHFLPRHPDILPATIGVSIIGPSNLPVRSLPTLLSVNRRRVQVALQFLQRHNHLYHDIIISDETLRQLPDNGIPSQLLSVIKFSGDMDVLEQEREGYVIDDDDADVNPCFDTHASVQDMLQDDVESTTALEPNVFPLQAHGVIDSEVTDLSNEDVLAHALANTSTCTEETYAVKHGSTFINEYPRRNTAGEYTSGGPDNPNHLLGAFPCLFPYGMGGFEVHRPRAISYENQAKWAMRYGDKRFRKDFHFMFQIFGVIQKRQVCRAAVLQVHKKAFHENEQSFRCLTAHDLAVASMEESKHQSHSNPVVRSLKQHVNAVRTKVTGTDESRTKIRALIWGMTMMKNPPSLWITINPSDTHDPIAQVLIGEDINLDAFDTGSGPDSVHRALNIAGDPYGASQFFHCIIRAILEEIFGITITSKGKINRQEGIFGVVEGYIGTVEAQGRGTLHLHLIVWLQGAPSSGKMKEMLQSHAFRERVAKYIASNIRGNHDDITEQTLSIIPRERAVSYTRPPDPRQPRFTLCCKQLEKQLVRAVQIHKCGPGCLKSRQGRLYCKRRAPFPVAEEAWIDVNGEWGPRRLYPFMNNWNPWILLAARANHDCKLITNGGDTKHISWYISTYAAKRQQHSSNASALLAKSIAYHRQREARNSDVEQLNRRLIQRCANCLSREQEFSAPEVMSYIMGWGDRYISHHFETIHWSSVVSLLKKTFPQLREHRSHIVQHTSEGEIVNISDRDPQPEYAVLEMHQGCIRLQDQIREYIDRPDELESLNYLEYFLNTYDHRVKHEEAETVPKRNNTHCYLSYKENSCHTGHVRVLRQENHDIIPHIPGRWFPRSDDRDCHPLYCASILALLTPWRDIVELKHPDESFDLALGRFLANTSSRMRDIIENIQYFHECSDKAKDHDFVEQSSHHESASFGRFDEDVLGEEESECTDQGTPNSISEDDITRAASGSYPAREMVYADVAMNIAEDYGFFSQCAEQNLAVSDLVKIVTDDQWAQYLEWDNLISHASECHEESPSESTADQGGVGSLTEIKSSVTDTKSSVTMSSKSPLSPSGVPEYLNEKQRLAFSIIQRYLDDTLCGREPSQLLMQIHGQGGTGKTKLLHAITELFASRGCSHALAKTALSGVAASQIGGSTLHSWATIPANLKGLPTSDSWIYHPSVETMKRRERNMRDKSLLVVDESSMLTTNLLSLVSQVTGAFREASGIRNASSTNPFGGLGVIIIIDFHQFPPVGSATHALYYPAPTTTKCQLGRNLYLQFSTVVKLDQQMRITDPVWHNILQRSREGACTAEDLTIIHSLVLSNDQCDVPDFSVAPWNDAILITPRNSVQTYWNNRAVVKHCISTKNTLYICNAEDSSHGCGLNMEQRFQTAKLSLKQTEQTPTILRLSIGMRVMVTRNLATSVNLCNGSRGRVVDIALDSREPQFTAATSQKSEVNLHYPPVLVIVELDFCDFPCLPGLKLRQVPLSPIQVKFSVGSHPTTRITRRQLPLIPAYAFTDYKAQGQTIDYILVDIGKTTCFSLSPFNAYVALSRSRGRQTIRLLREFEESLFTRHPSEFLREEDYRIEQLAKETRERIMDII